MSMEITSDISNIILYIDDAVRYDSCSSTLQELGKTFKTVAPSLHTPASFASIFTGYHVPTHGVTGFDTRFPNSMTSIFDLDVEVAISDKGGLNNSVAQMYPSAVQKPLSEMEPPYVWIERGPGGHAPYAGYDMDTFDFETKSGRDYLHENSGNIDKMQTDYQRGVDQGVNYFKNLIDRVNAREESDNTLLIYTSDHGEILGEYGFLGHNHIACPELVYVPTTFVHPDIKPGKSEKLLSGIDILPTISDLLDGYVATDGLNVFSEEDRDFRYNHYESKVYGEGWLRGVSRTEQSVWTADGGYARTRAKYAESIVFYAGLLLKSHAGKQIMASRNWLGSLTRILPGGTIYPDISNPEKKLETAINHLSECEYTAEDEELGEETKEQLEQLGYI